MDSGLLYTCSICKGKFEVGKIRYSKDGKRLVCFDCYSAPNRTVKEGKKKVEVKLEPFKKKVIKLICLNCRYKFSWNNESRISLICPYCGSKSLTKNEITAEKLIQDVSDKEESHASRSLPRYRKIS